MGFISYHRAGVAKRQARAAIRASRRLGGALDDVRAQNEQLIEVVERQAAVIERLERELGDLRARLDEDDRRSLRSWTAGRLSEIAVCERVERQ